MKELWGAEKLEAELEAAKDGLRGLEKNIRKILGRDVPEGENGTVAPVSTRIAQKRPIQDDVRGRRQGLDFPNNGFGAKRRWQQGGPGGGGGGGGGSNNNNTEPKTVFSRLSARVSSTADDSDNEDDNAFKPAVSSRVIATPREIPSRQDVIRRESTDERSKQRNRRMFGALLGTLQKFRQEETKLKAKEDKKAEVEARVEEAKRKEREELKRERQQLFLNRKQQLAQVKALEAKLARSKQYQEWRSAQIPLLNFIKTKAQPPIYYLPKRSIPETDTLLQQSAKELKAEIDKREKALVDDLEMIQAQVGDAKNSHDKSNENLDQSMEEPEEEENRDPNPEKNGDVEMEEADKSASSNSKIKKQSSKNKEKDKEEQKNDEDKEVDRYETMEEDKEEEGEEDKEDKEGNAGESGEISREKSKIKVESDSLEESREEIKDEGNDKVTDESKNDSKEESTDESKDDSREESTDTSKDESKDDLKEENAVDSQSVKEEKSSQLDREDSNISIQAEQDEKFQDSSD